jgi:hypothetical protein
MCKEVAIPMKTANNVSRQMRYQIEHKKKGLCFRCPNKIADNSVRACDECLKKDREHARRKNGQKPASITRRRRAHK